MAFQKVLSGTKSTANLLLDRLDYRSARVYFYLIGKIGTDTRVPRSVAIKTISQRTSLSYKQVRTCISILIKGGYIEKWTTTFSEKGAFRRKSYYRIK